FASGATGSPLGPGSAGCVTTEPVVSLASVADPLDASLLFGVHRSLSFDDEEQPPSHVRHVATTIRTRATRILINALRTTTRPAKSVPARGLRRRDGGPAGRTAPDTPS